MRCERRHAGAKSDEAKGHTSDRDSPVPAVNRAPTECAKALKRTQRSRRESDVHATDRCAKRARFAQRAGSQNGGIEKKLGTPLNQTRTRGKWGRSPAARCCAAGAESVALWKFTLAWR